MNINFTRSLAGLTSFWTVLRTNSTGDSLLGCCANVHGTLLRASANGKIRRTGRVRSLMLRKPLRNIRREQVPFLLSDIWKDTPAGLIVKNSRIQLLRLLGWVAQTRPVRYSLPDSGACLRLSKAGRNWQLSVCLFTGVFLAARQVAK